MLTFSQINFDKDVNQVVKLIQLNLDPEVTRDFFRNKHLKNPFGQSFGVVASMNNKIIGVRMGLYWKFINHSLDQKIRSVRPVDTVVSREYRKQGIFTKMNQEFMKILAKKDADLIFNTPNKRSFPANIRMGWKVLGNRNHFKVGIVYPLRRVVGFKKIHPSQIFWKTVKTDETYFHTYYRDNFFEWRYDSGKYRVASFNKENSNCIIYSTTRIRGMKTIIVYDLLGEETFYSTMINSLGSANNCFFIYFLNNTNWKKVGFLLTFKRDTPNVLFRNDRYSIRENIKFSVGDLEAII